MRVYLSGPITGLKYEEASAERERIARELESFGIEVVTPMRHTDMLARKAEGRPFGSGSEDDLRARRVVQRDGFDVKNCDVLLVDLRGDRRVSIGTVWEIGVAWGLGKPIFVVGGEAHHKHAMVIASTPWVFETIEEALSELTALVGPYARRTKP